MILLVGLKSLLEVLVTSFGKRRKPIIDQVLLPILINGPPFAELLYKSVVNSLKFVKRLILKLAVPMPVHIIHYVVVYRRFCDKNKYIVKKGIAKLLFGSRRKHSLKKNILLPRPSSLSVS